MEMLAAALLTTRYIVLFLFVVSGIECALMMIRDTKAHCVITPKHQAIYKMVDYDKLIKVFKKRILNV